MKQQRILTLNLYESPHHHLPFGFNSITYLLLIMDKITKASAERKKPMMPWPEDVFIPLSQEEIKNIVNCLQNRGHRVDALSAHFMRHGWKLCEEEYESHIRTLEKELEELKHLYDKHCDPRYG